MTPDVEDLIEKARDLPAEDHRYSLEGGYQWRGDVVAYKYAE